MRISDWSSDVCSSDLRRLTQARGAEAARLTFPATTDGYRALHKHLFQDLYDWAGQDRTVNIAKGGSSFAAVPYVARELDKRFADMGAQSGFRGLPRDEFFDRLGDHRSEENKSELQSLMRISYAVFCLKTQKYRSYKNTN